MVTTNIKKHDQLSFEAKLEFPTNRDTGVTNNYNVSMFLFLPYGLDINKHNFTREDFYNSLKTNVRLTTPFFNMVQIIEGDESPYIQLQNSIVALASFSNDKTKPEYEKQIKRFSSIFKSALRYEVNKIIRQPEDEKKMQLINNYERNARNIRSHFKKLRKGLNDLPAEEKHLSIHQYADEYQSQLVEKDTAFLLKTLSKKAHKKSEVLISLNKMVLDEMDYRSKMGYPSVILTTGTNIDTLHRMARLKKYVESNLYLNTDTIKEGVVTEQVLFSIAAGIAMIFATGVAFASQMLYGSLSLPFFIALVVGYMFKDRIKELIRVFLSKKHQKVFYDFKTKIYQNKREIGNLKESFNFELHSHLPDEILNVRNNMRATEITEESLGEKIIHYRTKVKIRNKMKTSSDFSGVTQILRFNISDFIRKMDDPEKEVLIRTKNGFKRAFSDRVYHMNLILTYTNNKKREIKPYKIYTNRKGIRKIEKIRNFSLIKN